MSATDGAPSPKRDATPLVVDVDGTLIQGNLLVEGLAQLLARAPAKVLALLPWLLRGRAFLKRKVAEAATVAPETLVRNPQVAAEIEAARSAGRPVHLATGADALAAAPVAMAVGAADVFASDGRANLVGRKKAEALVAAFGRGGFDYIGDERRDLPAWRCARRAVGAGLGRRLQAKVRGIDPQARFLQGQSGGLRAYVQALRPAHWSKNALLFVPLLAAHETALASWLAVLGMFAAFSALVSGTYVLNDLLDLPYDRRHAHKRRRPLASGPAAGGTRARRCAGAARRRLGDRVCVVDCRRLVPARVSAADVGLHAGSETAVVPRRAGHRRTVRGSPGRRRRCGGSDDLGLAGGVFAVPVPVAGNRQALDSTARRSASARRPRLRRPGRSGADGARWRQRLRRGGGAGAVHPEPGRCGALRPAGGPLARLPAVDLLAESRGAAGQTAARWTRIRSCSRFGIGPAGSWSSGCWSRSP